MIYLENIDESQTIWIPVSTSDPVAWVTMDLTSTIELQTLAESFVNADMTIPGYVKIAVNPVALELTPGTWEYTVSRSGNIYGKGVLMILTDMLPYRKVYEKNITYEQYDNGVGE